VSLIKIIVLNKDSSPFAERYTTEKKIKYNHKKLAPKSRRNFAKCFQFKYLKSSDILVKLLRTLMPAPSADRP
jgi:hypothetical protein